MARAHPLLALLALEREIIIAGDFAALRNLAPRKEKLMQALPSDGPATAVLSQISAAIDHNQTLLQAAMDGVGHVIKRMEEVRKGRESFDSYGPLGVKSTVGGRKSAFERKA